MRSINDASISEQIQPTHDDEEQAIFKACTLYSMNDILFQQGMISADKKQKVDQEIWKKYRV